jgi:ribosome-binding protein aMBF1 (putative translation factor)
VNAKRVEPAPGESFTGDNPSDVRRTFARNLRQAREAAGLTQHALSKNALYDHRHLAEIEAKAANVKLDTITRLARPLGLTEIDLLLPNMDISLVKRVRHVPAEPLSKTEPSELRRRFAHNLRETRQAAGLFQKALAEATGIQVASVGDIEVHAANVTLDTVTRLARALGVTEIDLLGPRKC